MTLMLTKQQTQRFSICKYASAQRHNILKSALSTVGHTGTWILDPNALGDSASTLVGEILSEQVGSVNEESSPL